MQQLSGFGEGEAPWLNINQSSRQWGGDVVSRQERKGDREREKEGPLYQRIRSGQPPRLTGLPLNLSADCERPQKQPSVKGARAAGKLMDVFPPEGQFGE